VPQYSWNEVHPGEKAPHWPADILDGDGQLVVFPETHAGFKVSGGVWCDTETGVVMVMYKDYQTASRTGRMPCFPMCFKPPLTVIPLGSADEPRPIVVNG
jgi:hypothetical protein